jgi:hypothetical protein
MPNVLFGKSLICPTEATALKSAPRNFLIVLTFVGDSTIINEFAISTPYTLKDKIAPIKGRIEFVKTFINDIVENRHRIRWALPNIS